MSLSENLEKLSNACGVAGREEEVRNLMIKLMKPYADQVKIDKLENVIAIKKGKKNAPKVMLAAHMDEISLMVKTIGTENKEDAAKMGIRVGDPVTFDTIYAKVTEDTAIGKSYVDRIGCATMI